MSRFKHDFQPYIELVFQRMVDYTEPICQLIDSSLAQMLAFDASGIEFQVTENKPKTLNALIKKLKTFYKDKPTVVPYKMAYSLMPSQAVSCSDAKQMYINGHFCYADQFAILTNGLGIVRHSAFDSANRYGILMDDFYFSRALIPYNPRNESTLKEVGYNIYGYSTRPNALSPDMKYCGITKEKGRAQPIKWICPKMHYHKGWNCDCKIPGSSAKKIYGGTTYTYDNMDLRMFPGIQRDSKEWNHTYKTRTIVERAINHFKINMCIAGRKTRNHTTTKVDVFFIGIASQLTVIVAHAMNCPQYIQSLKPSVA